MKFFYVKYFSLFTTAMLYCALAAAQQVFYKENKVAFVKERATHFDEKTLRERMSADGLPPAVIDKLVEQHRTMWANGMHVEWNRAQTARNGTGNPNTCAICSDMSGESGWGAWQGAIGGNSGGNPPVWGSLGAPNAPNFNLNSGPGLDLCTPGFNVGDPPLPLVAPGFGTTSIELGEPQSSGSVTEQLVYPLSVAVTDTNFIYAYALVLEDAGHPDGERPYAEFVMLNPAGDTIPCAFFHYEAAEPNGQSLPGFYQGTCGAKYKPWTTVGVNLSNYVGQTVTLVITNADCIWGAHFAQSYWDFNCGILQGSSTSDCYGASDTLNGPDDPNITYAYQWYPGGQTTQSIIVQPQPGDTFIVEVKPPTGCNFYEIFVPRIGGINPAFTYSGSCGTINFHDASTTSSGLPVIGWQWSFPGGNPSSSTVQNPTIHYPAGNFTATLIVTVASGCSDTVTISGITTGVSPVAAFTASDVCLGSSIPFTDQSTSDASDPIIEWHWDFGDGSLSASHNPVHLFTNDSTYNVQLSVTTYGGCIATILHAVTVHPNPVADFSANIVCENTPTLFSNLSSGGNLQWLWRFGDGNTSAAQNPAHTYTSGGNFTAWLVAINGSGCKDSVSKTVRVNPEPAAAFTANKVCVGDQTCFTDLTTVATGNIVSWSWNFGDPAAGASNASDVENPCHTYTVDGTFNPVRLTVTSDSGCMNTVYQQVSFWELPQAAFSSNPVCLNMLTHFTDQSSEASVEDPLHSWNWNFGDSSVNSPQQNPAHTYTTAGWFNVQLVITSNHNCRDTVTKPARIYNLPAPEFSDSAEGCTPFCASFNDLSVSDDGSITDWQWTFAGGNPPSTTAVNPEVCYGIPGSFNVSLITTTSHGCKDTLMKPHYVNVYELPQADFNIAPDSLTSLLTPAFDFRDLWSGNVVEWQWDFGDGSPLESNVSNPSHSYGSSIDNNTYYSYLVTVYVQTEHGCRDSISRKVEVTPDFSFFVPNSFTPNGDHVNDYFYGKGRGISDYTISVYDRWGILLWTCHEDGLNTDWDRYQQEGMPSGCQWDGLLRTDYTGKRLQNDVYVWRVRLTTIFGEVKTYIGHVSAIK
jgi:gliding motility-associated-like protein